MKTTSETAPQYGLTQQEVADLLKSEGPNELPTARRMPLWRLALAVVREPMILLLVCCSALYLAIGEIQDSTLFLLMIFVLIGISLYQERRSTRAVEALRDLSSPRALVIREGEEIRVAGRDVVRGDLVILREGDRVPADAELVESSHLRVDESLLTGESEPVAKSLVHDRRVFSSTLVTSGQALCRVTATGPRTEVGKIGNVLSAESAAPTRLQTEMARIARIFGTIGFATSVMIALIFALTRGDWAQGALAGIGAAMSLLPEEFPVVMTIFMALGAWRLSRNRVLVRHTTATENLGAMTVLCVDKTGTLTMNQMTVRQLCANGQILDIESSRAADLPELFHPLIEYGVLASHRDPFDPMEKAILRVLLQKLAGTEHIHEDWLLQREYPLTHDLLAMSCVWKAREGDLFRIAAKGAPEAIADLCHLSAEDRAVLLTQVHEMSLHGMRILGVAKAEFAQSRLPDRQHDFDFEFVGLLGLEDPIRPQARAALGDCVTAGIRVIMITGDYPGTAAKVAGELGLDSPGGIVSGADIDGMSDEALAWRLKNVNIFARMIPEQKLRIVTALQKNGELVGMTGDGVNDAPSLKRADIGIAMGQRGTDVARESADLVLLDDDFTSIVEAIRLGRRIFDNIRRAMAYIFAVHFPIAGMAMAPVLFGLPLALLPAHIVFLELIIDPACTLIFETDEEAPDIMRRPPRKRDEKLFGARDIFRSSAQGAVVFAVIFLVFAGGLHGGLSAETSRAMSFIAFMFSNLILISVNRSWRHGLRNMAFWVVVACALIGLIAVNFVPFLQHVFGFAPLTLAEFAIALGASLLSFLLILATRRFC